MNFFAVFFQLLVLNPDTWNAANNFLTRKTSVKREKTLPQIQHLKKHSKYGTKAAFVILPRWRGLSESKMIGVGWSLGQDQNRFPSSHRSEGYFKRNLGFGNSSFQSSPDIIYDTYRYRSFQKRTDSEILKSKYKSGRLTDLPVTVVSGGKLAMSWRALWSKYKSERLAYPRLSCPVGY